MKKIKSLIRAIKIKGGLKSTFIWFLSLIKREKLAGVIKRLKTLNHYYDEYDEYQKWIENNENNNLDQKEIELLMSDIKNNPLISIVLPVYNPPLNLLRDVIESVINQFYGNWELCIADDCSINLEVKEILRFYQKEDSRIKVVFRAENGHISRSSNSALSIANGDYIALLDHDDLLSKNALYEVVKVINKNSDVKMIYSDEDKIDLKGNRFNPYFKCDWNLDLFLSHNMFSHFGVYDHDLLKKIKGFRNGYEGSQDYDLALRCLDYVNKKQIFHISKILYHWRVLPGSTALNNEEKPYAMIAGKKSIEDSLKRKGIKASVELLGTAYRVRYDLPKEQPLVSLVILTKNKYPYLKKCIESIKKKTIYKNYEIIIVNNNSDEDDLLSYLNVLKKEDNISIIHDGRPFNFSSLNNLAVKEAKGEVIGLVNNDIKIINKGWLSELVSHVCREGIGAVGAKLYYPNNTIQHAGVLLGVGGCAEHAHKGLDRKKMGYFGRARLLQSFSAVTGACLFVKKSIYNEVGGLDEDKFSVAYNDIDFCLKLKEKGYENIWTPYAEAYHYESLSRGLDSESKNHERFEREQFNFREKWRDYLDGDPAYNCNLSRKSGSFEIG